MEISIFHLSYFDGFPIFVPQCAAVRTSWELIRLPPQKGLEDLEDRRPTCQGYSLASVLTPPTILDTVFAWPHLHDELGAGAGAGDGVGDVAGGGRKIQPEEREDRSSQTQVRGRLIIRLVQSVNTVSIIYIDSDGQSDKLRTF